ncbi:folate-Biopterin Transporter (FBT) family [Achlya hypogyna]|uniref:Folate-Biopterin Transporter (FBT) family n=1 Tax=Achlya hypogyna TaxID=1202772 RepID=A0A1V9YUJ6_ACHHY|nr:folate-Biopterin Transporter (FBT) family [Achlya hypogyna]
MLQTKEPLTTERVSYIASLDKDAAGDGYDEAKTPGDIEDGALRGGDAPVYTSVEVLAIIYQYAMVGIVYGGFTVMKYPIFTGYFQLETNVLSSATALLTLGWSLKVVFGMFNDCFPIFGYHRKPYMMIGWTLCAIILVIIAIKPSGDQGSQSDGSTFALLCTVCGFCYVMADVAQDALMLTYAQREPLNVRGRLQSIIYGTRFVFAAIIGAICGFCLNSEKFAGDFDWDIGVNGYFWILAVPSVINVPIVWFFIKDQKAVKVPFSVYIGQFWALVQKRAVWQVLIFNFLFNFFTGSIGSTAGSYVQLYWAGVTSLNSSIMGVVGNIVFAIILYVTGLYGTNWNWRYVLVITILAANGIDAVCQFCTIYNVYRNQWFYLGVPVLEQIPIGINFVVGTYVIVELAEPGNEGVMYGLLTTVSNLPGTFGTLVMNVIDAQFDYNKALIKTDTPAVRHSVAYSYLVAYGSVIIGCFWVFLLPSQKAAVAELKKHGGSYPKVATFIFFALFTILCTSVTGNLSSMFESTRCLKLAGGNGCKVEPTSYLAGIFVPVGLALLLIAKVALTK